MDKEELQLKKRLMDLAEQSYRNNIFTFSGFLSLSEQQVLLQAEREFSARFELFGGNSNCERCMVRFGSEDDLGYLQEYPIVCLHVKPLIAKFSDTFSHRDFLGAIMNLGIERSTIGDIVLQDNTASLYCHEKMAQYLMDELTKVKHTHVKCEKIESVELLPQKEPVPKEFIVASGRIDVVVAKVYNLSRSACVELFRSKRIFVNGKTQENNSYFLKEKDVVTARGFGKFIFEKQLGQTKKERVKILVSEYK